MSDDSKIPSDPQLDTAVKILLQHPIPQGPDASVNAHLINMLNNRAAGARSIFRIGPISSSPGAFLRRAIAAILILSLGTAALWVVGHHDSTALGDEVQTVQIQVTALRMLHDLHATPDQIRAVQALASDTQASSISLEGSDPHATTAPSYPPAIKGLRDALLTDDDEKIETAQDKVDDLEDKHDIDSDPGIDPTEPARAKANDAIKLFSPGQIADYISANSEDFPDPTQTLLSALSECRGGPVDDFTSLRDDTAQEIGSLIGGAQPKRSRPIAKNVTDLLNKARDLSDSDFATQHSDLEKEARDITAAADPVDVLRHWLHNQMANLLSNPQLSEVLSEKLAGH